MFTANQYIRAQSIEEAYQLNQKRSTTILGGGGWLRLGRRQIGTLVDLCDLKLDAITETDTEFVVGAMTTLRSLEKSEALAAQFGNYFERVVQGIVGVQFRNCATVGGSVVGRFGFSDVLTGLLALDCQVELASRGRISLQEYTRLPYDNDILTHIYIQKNGRRAVYYSQRNAATDLPVLTCAVSVQGGAVKAAIGARPTKAALVPADFTLDGNRKAFLQSAQSLPYGGNMRGSADYRRHLAGVLLDRSLNELIQGEQ